MYVHIYIYTERLVHSSSKKACVRLQPASIICISAQICVVPERGWTAFAVA